MRKSRKEDESEEGYRRNVREDCRLKVGDDGRYPVAERQEVRSS